MIGFSTFPASHLSTVSPRTMSSSIKAPTSRPSDCVFTSWFGAPLQFTTLTNSYVFPYVIILIIDLCCAKRLYLVRSKSNLTALLHTGQFHGITRFYVNSEVVCNTIDTKLMPTFKSKEIFLIIVAITHVTKTTCAILTFNCFSINKVLVETFPQ